MIKKELKIKPYARLLTMLGEQLIKNEQIALIELIKNAYDADADWVKITFSNFTEDLGITSESMIIIEDNGEGMTMDTIEKSWMNPATPNKLSKDGKVKRSKKKKRILQGEKGIGRFAILKLGKDITIITRPENSPEEFKIEYNFSIYDDNFLSKNGVTKELYIDDLSINFNARMPEEIIDREVKVNHEIFKKNNKGTKIVIKDLKGKWSDDKVSKISAAISKLQSVFDKIFDKKYKDKFEIGIVVNGKRITASDEYIRRLSVLFDDKSVLKITNGMFNNKENCFHFETNGENNKIRLSDPEIRGLRVFRQRFQDKKNKNIYSNPECGNFTFNFFVFDLNAKDPSKYYIPKPDRELIKEHRVYLYRDGIRVYPYGEPDDDWLKIDTYRGTISAGEFLSNDQVVGWIEITKDGNPRLIDKTNREGLIEEGNITGDFLAIIQTFLSYLRKKLYAHYLDNNKNKNAHELYRTETIKDEFELLKENFKSDNKILALINNVEQHYLIEKNYLERRATTTEELAAVGLSVETASHDIMLMLTKSIEGLKDLLTDCIHESIKLSEVTEELQKLLGMFTFVKSQVQDIQLLFTSSKQRRRAIRVRDVFDKVHQIYKRILKLNKINCQIEEVNSPLIAKCTDADLMQLFINLFDNSCYWLSTVDRKEKKIYVLFDGNKGKLIFSDNGPGIKEADKPYIFEAFYSGKGEEGRGLGLYIAKRLLERNDYFIEIADVKSDTILTGANLVVNFIGEK